MSEPFIGQIKIFGGEFAPRNWAFCDGQLLSISENTALFSILGTTYGGDGRTTFGLPELRGRVPMHAGHGPGLNTRRLGEKSGLEQNYLNTLNLPSHNHSMQFSIPVSEDDATTNEGGSGLLSTTDGAKIYGGPNDAVYSGGPINATVGQTGASQGVNNLAPYQTINYIIALVGTYPSRS